MTEKELELFKNLHKLTKENEAFYITEQVLDDVTYWIFLYRIASYSDFMLPDALESRGIMFEMDGEEPIRLACRPPQKFFNLGENPVTLDLDHSKVTDVMIKEDGSLISTFWHNGELRLKTKGSLHSEQALAAMDWLNKPENSRLKGFLRYLTNPEEKGITVNLEWVSPLNRIVLDYKKPGLVILNLRYTESGDYVKYSAEEVQQYFVNSDLDFYKGKSLEELKAVTGIEGWVCIHENGTWFKLKTDWYVNLHTTRNSITNAKSLFNIVLNEQSDDLRQLFETDLIAIKMIEVMEGVVEYHYNHLSSIIDNFWKLNHTLEQKEYAIAAQQLAEKQFVFPVLMALKNGKNLSLKDIMRKKYSLFVNQYEEEIRTVLNI